MMMIRKLRRVKIMKEDTGPLVWWGWGETLG